MTSFKDFDFERDFSSSFQQDYQSFQSPTVPRKPSFIVSHSTGELWNRKVLAQYQKANSSLTLQAKGKFLLGSWMRSFEREFDFNGPIRSSNHTRNFSIPTEPSLFDHSEDRNSPFSPDIMSILGSDNGFRDTVDTIESPHKSSTTQFIFNSVNLFVGVGLLSLPYTFKENGWIMGTAILCFAALLSNYTLKLLTRAMDYTESSTYSELGEKIFGSFGRTSVTIVMFAELFFCACSYIILVGDLVELIIQDTPYRDEWFATSFMLKTFVFFTIMLPTMAITSLRILSFGSLVGILSSMMLGIVLIYDGFSTNETPGSILKPAPTKIWPAWDVIRTIPSSFAIIMYNFSGGTVIPNLYRDMRKPQTFSSSINFTILIVLVWFLAFSSFSYLMFGDITKPEITNNLMELMSNNVIINKALLFLMVLNPLTKFSLILNPVCYNLELYLIRPMFNIVGPETRLVRRISTMSVETYESFPTIKATFFQFQSSALYPLFCALLRFSIASMAYLVAVTIPDFSGILTLIGSFFSFTASGAFPILLYWKANHSNMNLGEKFMLSILLLLCMFMIFIAPVWKFVFIGTGV